MFPPKPGDPEGQLRASSHRPVHASSWTRPAQDSMDEVKPGEENRVFYRLSVPQKVIVMLGGPTMNLLIAVVLLGGILTLYGIPTATPLISHGRAPASRRPPRRWRSRSPTASPATPRPRRRWPACRRATGSSPSTGRRSRRWDQVTAADPPVGRTRPMTIVVDRGGSQVTLRGADRRPEPGRLRRQRQGQGRRQRQRHDRAGGVPRRRRPPASWSRARSCRCPAFVWNAFTADRRRRRQRAAEDGRRRAGGLRVGRARPQRPRSRWSASAASAARSPAPTSAPTGPWRRS